MRKKLVIGNWKMNLDYSQAKSLLQQLIQQKERRNTEAEIVVCPSSLYLSVFAELTADHGWLNLGAQNCYDENAGAFTGEIAPAQLRSLEIRHCIVGHSERRNAFNEDYTFLAKKVTALIEQGMSPIFCCGEQLQVRDSNVYKEFVMNQLEESLFSLSPEELAQCIIAYEPIWAIGTGKTATAEQAQEVHHLIRTRLATHFGQEVSDRVPIVYGGSCNPENAEDLFEQPDIDGGLIGGASLNADHFYQISNAFQ